MDYDAIRTMNILIVKLSAIGDVVQTLPAVEAIKRTYPDSAITWVVEEAAVDILKGHFAIDRVLVSRRKEWLRKLKHPGTVGEGAGEIRKFVKSLRERKYDLAIDFQGLLKSGIIIGLTRAKRKIGFDKTREWSYLFLNERLPAFDKEKHALERYLDIARYLGARSLSTGCTLPIEEERDRMKNRLAEQGMRQRPLIVMNPVARWTTKLWVERNFAELADRLIDEKKAAVIFTGSRADRFVVDRILGMMRNRAVNWAGETNLRELGGLAELADLFITTDTGPMHLAAATGTRVLALFGPTAPGRTGPYGQNNTVIRTEKKCAPCFKRTCVSTSTCMEEISVQQVMGRIPF